MISLIRISGDFPLATPLTHQPLFPPVSPLSLPTIFIQDHLHHAPHKRVVRDFPDCLP